MANNDISKFYKIKNGNTPIATDDNLLSLPLNTIIKHQSGDEYVKVNTNVFDKVERIIMSSTETFNGIEEHIQSNAILVNINGEGNAIKSASFSNNPYDTNDVLNLNKGYVFDTVKTEGNGNAYTYTSVSNNTLTLHKGTTFFSNVNAPSGNGNVVTSVSFNGNNVTYNKDLSVYSKTETDNAFSKKGDTVKNITYSGHTATITYGNGSTSQFNTADTTYSCGDGLYASGTFFGLSNIHAQNYTSVVGGSKLDGNKLIIVTPKIVFDTKGRMIGLDSNTQEVDLSGTKGQSISETSIISAYYSDEERTSKYKDISAGQTVPGAYVWDDVNGYNETMTFSGNRGGTWKCLSYGRCYIERHSHTGTGANYYTYDNRFSKASFIQVA